jgi:hypothetical protein
MLDTIDKHISDVSESVARTLNRRKFLTRSTKGLFVTVAAVTLAQWTAIKDAFAITCDCNWAYGNHCNNCPGIFCPSGCSICTTSSGCGGVCNYDNGYWTSCSGFGTCHHGYRICTDCKCGGCGRSQVCTCLSGIICSGCCTAKDIEEEKHRLQQLAAQEGA